MEVDILNDLLTRTVSNLFSNKMKHMSYLSEDDGNKQEEIFPQQEPLHHSNHNNQKANINTHNINHSNNNNNNNNNNNQNEQPRKNLIEKIINNNINNNQKNNKQNNQNQQEAANPKTWCMTVGKKKYEESLHRLQINERMIASRTLINEMSLEQLTNEKARVKQELKKYDEDFFQVFKSKPTKENKEIMKPLYYYYQKLKLAISKKSEQGSNNSTVAETIVRNERHNNASNNASNNNTIQTIFPSNMTDNTESNMDSESIITQEVTYGSNTELISNTSDSNRQSKFSQNNNSYHNSMNNAGNKGNNNNMNYNVFHRKANSGGGVSSNSQLKNEDFNINRNQQKRSLSKDEINALEQEYYSIKKEQNNLTQMLRNYQNEFQKTNNRKVKWTKDIKPVEKEYNKYKANKERIKQIKELFGHIENNNK